MTTRTIHGITYYDHGDESRGAPVGSPDDVANRAWYRAKTAEAEGTAKLDRLDAAEVAAPGITIVGETWRVTRLADRAAVKALVSAGDFIEYGKRVFRVQPDGTLKEYVEAP